MSGCEKQVESRFYSWSRSQQWLNSSGETWDSVLRGFSGLAPWNQEKLVCPLSYWQCLSLSRSLSLLQSWKWAYKYFYFQIRNHNSPKERLLGLMEHLLIFCFSWLTKTQLKKSYKNLSHASSKDVIQRLFPSTHHVSCTYKLKAR